MAGETGKIAALAERVSTEVFSWFKWSYVPVLDHNFNCDKQAMHAPSKKAQHTHPVDIVFHYVDPYLNKRIFLNTDLKSYSRTSIKAENIRTALKSLAQTIDCARVSQEWSDRYRLIKDNWEVRGLLFVYNHDTAYDESFYSFFNNKNKHSTQGKRGRSTTNDYVRIEGLPLKEGQLLHIVEPLLINYLVTVLSDVQTLHYAETFPKNDYSFFYPELQLHRAKGKEEERPATIELLSGPYMIVRHGVVKSLDEKTGTYQIVFPAGHLIYYNRPGVEPAEFVYLLDTLSRYQILNGSSPIRLRLVHHAISPNARSNFASAIEIYIQEWGYDTHIRDRLRSIDVDIVTSQRQAYAIEDTGWRKK